MNGKIGLPYKYSDKQIKSFKEKSIKFWTNKIFNNCIIIKPVNINKTTANSKWEIKCHCGNIFEATPGHLQSGDTKSCGCLRSLNSKNNILKLHQNNRINRGYNKDQYISNITDFIRDSLFKDVKKFIFKIDGYTCNLCLQESGELVVHHVIPISTINYFNKKEDFKIVYNIHNLITLCNDCHKNKAHNNNFLDINNNIQEELHEIIKLRNINKQLMLEYNEIVASIERKIDNYLKSLSNV